MVGLGAEAKRGEQFNPPLVTDELAAYDAIADNASALDVLGQDVLADIARQLVAMMRADVKLHGVGDGKPEDWMSGIRGGLGVEPVHHRSLSAG